MTMLLTIRTAHRPATDLGFLLHKHPEHVHTREFPFGNATCLKGARVKLPTRTQRIDLPGNARVLMRVELGADPREAIALQHGITMHATGTPAIAAPVDISLFTNDALPGVEGFDSAPAVLSAEEDINPGAHRLQAKVRAVAAAAGRSVERGRFYSVIREKGWRTLRQKLAMMGVEGHGWMRPKVVGTYGDDWLMRTAANYSGIWANTSDEVMYFGIGTGTPLDGGRRYTATFPKGDLPGDHVKYFWSVIAVDGVTFRVIPNVKKRFLLNPQSELQFGHDGSLTLYFAPRRPPGAPDGNWLPTPSGQPYLLTWRSYGPDEAILSGAWFPPPLLEVSSFQEAVV